MITGLSQNLQTNIAKNHNKNTNHAISPKMTGLQADSVSFGRRITDNDKKLRVFAQKYLNEIGLKPSQPLHITAESKYVPFLRIITEEAYKKDSGDVVVKVVEPEIEALKKKYKIKHDFEYKQLSKKELEEDGAIFVTFDKNNCPYEKAGLSKHAAKAQAASITPKIPKKAADLYKLDSEEILKTALDLHPGEPIAISGQREHLPQITKLMKYLYTQNQTKLINVSLSERKEFDRTIPYYEHANEALIGKIKPSTIAFYNEYIKKDVARLNLYGPDPKQRAGLSAEAKKRVTKDNVALSKATEQQREAMTSSHPWLMLWYPGVKAAQAAYPEYGNNSNKAIAHALKDAKLINRTGKLGAHVRQLDKMAKKMNDLVDKGYLSLHFVSTDPVTKKPDGKTDLIVGLSDKSVFNAARTKMEKTGHNVLVNIPTEEVFTAPKAFASEEEIQSGIRTNVTRGKVSATMPLVLNGNVVEDIVLDVEDAKITKATASQNQELLRDHIKENENADKFGEVALVAGSPIFKLGRVFFNTLLDENAACHIALGDAYSDTVKGANKIADYDKMQEYIKKQGVNQSTTHNDFMIGSPNVEVYAINEKTQDKILVMKDDKFQL